MSVLMHRGYAFATVRSHGVVVSTERRGDQLSVPRAGRVVRVALRRLDVPVPHPLQVGHVTPAALAYGIPLPSKPALDRGARTPARPIRASESARGRPPRRALPQRRASERETTGDRDDRNSSRLLHKPPKAALDPF